MTGKSYTTQRGINNLCYRGNRYRLDEVVPSGTMPYKMGVINLNMDTPVQVQTPDEGWEDGSEILLRYQQMVLLSIPRLRRIKDRN